MLYSVNFEHGSFSAYDNEVSVNPPVDLTEVTSHRGFVHQTFWQLTAVFFSGVVALQSVCRLNVWGDS